MPSEIPDKTPISTFSRGFGVSGLKTFTNNQVLKKEIARATP